MTHLQKLVSNLTDAIDDACRADEISKEELKTLYRSIFYILAGRPDADEEFIKFCKRKRKTKTLNELVAAMGNEIKLPQVLHASLTKDVSIKNAKALWKVSHTDLKLISKIAAIAGVDAEAEQHLLRNYYSTLDLPWFAEVEKELEDVEVIIGREALEDMLLGVIETYKVRKSKTVPFSEVFGLCLGMSSRQKTTKKGKGTRTTWFVYVDKAVPQIRARGNADSVQPNTESVEALVETSGLLFPQLEIMGDYHSHPFHSIRTLKAEKGWEASSSDGQDVFWRYRYLREHPVRKHRMRVSFVIAIAKSRARPTVATNLRGNPNVLRISLAGCQIYLAAYRILSNGVMTGSGVSLVRTASNPYTEAV